MAICTLAREARSREVKLGHEIFHAVVGHRRRIGIKRVGFDDVGAGLKKRRVNLPDYRRPCQRQQIVVALEVSRRVTKAITAIVVLGQSVALDHRAHRPVEQHDALVQALHQ